MQVVNSATKAINGAMGPKLGGGFSPARPYFWWCMPLHGGPKAMSPVPFFRTLLVGAAPAVLLFSGCGPAAAPERGPRTFHTTDYDLVVPAEQKALLVLFPCFACDAADTRSESTITDEAVANGVAVLLMDFDRHLLLSDAERTEVLDVIARAVQEHGLVGGNTFIGGFSSGGNVSLLLAKALLQAPHPPLTLKGVFAVDSPLDLMQLYAASERRVARTSAPVPPDEARMVLALLDSALGAPAANAAAYEARSPLTPSAANAALFKHLPVRFYTEPDTAWWRVNRGMSYADLNAFALQRIHAALQAAGNSRAEYTTTTDRGIQHGHRHPHAWSIVDGKGLVQWVLALPD